MGEWMGEWMGGYKFLNHKITIGNILKKNGIGASYQ
jgi:hypothetical protein